MDYKYHGIILSKRDLAEMDRVYTIYTREKGKIRIIGKGVRKSNAKLAGSLEPVTYAEIFAARGQGIGKITGAIPVENFSVIKSDFELLERVFRTFRILQKIISEEEKDEDFFRLFLEYLQTMENLGGNSEDKKLQRAEILTLGFLIKFLDQMGYRVEVRQCMECGEKLKPLGNFFSAARGGMLCFQCSVKESNKVEISAESIKILRIFLKNDVKNLIKLQVSLRDINNVKIIIKNLIDWSLGVNT